METKDGRSPPATTARDRAVFLKRWLRRPLGIGSVTPSSQALGRAMARTALAGLPADSIVVELGAGTGSITRALLAAGVPERSLVPVELDGELHAYLQRTFPSLRLLQGDAARLPDLLVAHNVAPVGAVVSGLPLLAMPGPVVEAIVTGVASVLPPGGALVQFTYGPKSPVPPELLRRLHLEPSRGRRIWTNLPPAVVWRFVRQR
ncbi:methyltransferase domain-containing protein [Reyranella sp. CPCC 100927]|nr:methyltransferase domain-containing protein [Reyranella sp. CPCC 100927]